MILDCGIRVIQDILKLDNVGVFASALIKKRQYRPRRIKGKEIKDYSADYQVREIHCLPGELNEVKFDAFTMKEPDCVPISVSIYGSLIENEG